MGSGVAVAGEVAVAGGTVAAADVAVKVSVAVGDAVGSASAVEVAVASGVDVATAAIGAGEMGAHAARSMVISSRIQMPCLAIMNTLFTAVE